MNRAMINSLTEAERLFIAETERAALHQLSEDELIALHARARQMRNKYVGLYRRQASSKVGVKGGRGAARPASNRNRDRAEVFEDALSRVSTRLAAVARAAAAELRAERIQAAREAKGAAPAAASRRVATAPTKSAGGAAKSASGGAVKAAPNPRRGERSLKSPISAKNTASTTSATRRKQARKDSR